MALADDNAGKKEFFITFILYISLIPSLGQMAFNVPAVCDGFVARISKPLGLQGYKTVAE